MSIKGKGESRRWEAGGGGCPPVCENRGCMLI